MTKSGKAEKILGYMSQKELEWLASQAETHETIVELGSLYGRSTRALAENTPGRVIAIDLWVRHGRDILPAFVNNTRDLLESGKLFAIRADHGEVSLKAVPDMVFIDGDHEYEAVKRDILKWQGALAVGGLLCGHDYSFPGVFQAVNELLAHTVIEGTDIWCSSQS